MRFTLDTNVLIYAIDRDAGAKHKTASSILAHAAEKDCVLTLQSLSECFVATTRKSLMPQADAAGYVADLQAVFDIVAADADSLNNAIEAVRDAGFSFWDAMLWATAKAAGCACILTEDIPSRPRFGGVDFVNPFTKASAATVTAILEK